MNSKQKLRWGILGTGRMAGDLATALAEVEGAELHAVGSRSLDTASRFAGKYSIPRHFASYAELVADPDVDVVYVSTPHSKHMEDTLLALEHGKAVLCEKPFALNATQAMRMIEAARYQNLFLMEAMWTRFVPSVVKLREIVSSGVLGDIQLMLAGGAYMPDFDPDYYLFRAELGGGLLLDSGIYPVSMASMLFGRPVKIQASGEIGKHGVDDHDAMLLTHESGQIASLYVSNRAQNSPDMTLMGNKGRIYVHAPIFCPAGLTISIYGENDEFLDYSGTENGYAYQLRAVNECLRSDKTECEIMPLSESMEIMQTMDEIRRQIRMVYPEDQ